MGISKRSHHSALLSALCIPKIAHVIERDTVSLCKRVLNVDSPLRDLQIFFLSQVIVSGHTVKGCLIDRVMNYDASPLILLLDPDKCPNLSKPTAPAQDGVADSLQYLLAQSSYNKPYSLEHRLATLLTKAF